jgi:hypothetical protein
MRWRDRLRSERGEMTPHAPRSACEPELGYAFDPEKYPALADAADQWADVLNSRVNDGG